MPDISMCMMSKHCSKAHKCYRAEESGTVPKEYNQAYIIPNQTGELCTFFWSTVTEEDKRD